MMRGALHLVSVAALSAERQPGITAASLGSPQCSRLPRRRKMKLDKLKRRGKGPPKKGAGKRSSKR